MNDHGIADVNVRCLHCGKVVRCEPVSKHQIVVNKYIAIAVTIAVVLRGIVIIGDAL